MKSLRWLIVPIAATLLAVSATARADVPAPDTGGSSATGGATATTGGTLGTGGVVSTSATSTTAGSSATGTKPPDDDGGCSIGTRHQSSGFTVGLLGLALALGLRLGRRRS
jgi:hypothetical protein